MAEILSLEKLAERVGELRGQGRTVVLSHGVFDLVHPGMIRHLEEARRQGDALAVTIVSDRAFHGGPVKPIFHEDLRAANAASLKQVDLVCVVDTASPSELVRVLKPDVFAKGQPVTREERETHDFLFADGADLEGTQVFESSPLISHSSGWVRTFLDVYPDETRAFLRSFARRYPFDDVRRWVDGLKDLTVMLVGDTIIDEYEYTRPLGKSAKSTLVVNQSIGREVFAGGALAIANHLAGLVKEVHLVTLLGGEDSREDFIRGALRPNVRPTFFHRNDGPTIVKKRYLDQYLNQKLFEINYLNTYSIEGRLENAVNRHLGAAMPACDVVLVSDYGHGFITRSIIRHCEKLARILAVNTQNNGANAGYNMITKYRRSNFVCLDESEMRFAAQDKESPIEKIVRRMIRKLGCDYLISTLGKKGSMGITKGGEVNRTPIFSAKVVDTIGAGDAYFAFTAPCIVHETPLDLLSFLGNAAGALAVTIIGNKRPVEKDEFLDFAQTLLT